MPKEVPKEDHALDMVGETCPYPSIESKNHLNRMSAGEVLLCVVGRKGKEKRNLVDISRENDKELADIERGDDTYRIWIRKTE